MSKKPAFMYSFKDSSSASTFLDRANQDPKSSFAQHPIDATMQKRDEKKVLVTGSGSLLFDTNLKNALDRLAEELGGTYEPIIR